MKRFLLILLAYLLAMIQVGTRAWFPDLLLLLVITTAVFEERNFALVAGLLAGLFLDAGNPSLLGGSMVIYLLIAYGVTLVRRLVYERVFYTLSFCGLALAIKYTLSFALSGAIADWWQVAISSVVTLALLVPVYRLIKLIFRYQWKVA
jgi:rod shape-determining protein MreD